MNPIKACEGDTQYFDFKSYYSYIASILPKEGSILEVGTYQGASIVWLATELLKRKKKYKIYTLDNWMDMEFSSGINTHFRFVQNVHLNNLEDIIFPLYGNSSITGLFKYSSLDYIFLDGSHEYEAVKWDISHLLPKLKPGGKIGGHDYGFESVKKAVDAAFPSIKVFSTGTAKLWHTTKISKKLGVIIPYRNREDSLYRLIPYLFDYLTERDFDFKIYVIEQSNEKEFNRGKLLNIGYMIAENEVDYIVFNNVDLLPVDVDYYYWDQPIHLSNESSPSDNYGGTIMFPKEAFRKVNGYSNLFYNWGGEDDDMLNRIKVVEIPVLKKPSSLIAMDHDRSQCIMSEKNQRILDGHVFNSGLSDLYYNIIEDTEDFRYRRIKVKI